MYKSPREFRSEQIEPFATYMLGVGGMRVIDYRDNYIANPRDEMAWYGLANEMVAFWYLVNNCLNTIGAYCAGKGPTHFNIAMNNETRRIADFLEQLGGVNPITEKDRFNSRDFNFDHLIKSQEPA
jgi:hypothetical protein